MIIPITQTMKRKAEEYQNIIEEDNRKRGVGKRNDLKRDNSYYYGNIGEQAFEYLLKSEKKKYTHYQAFEYGRDFDIFIKDFRIASVDVKTAIKENHTRLMFPVSQSDYRKGGEKYDIYVGTKIKDDLSIEICGYCKFIDLKLKQDGFDYQKVPTYYIEIENLSPIEKLIDLIEDEDHIYKGNTRFLCPHCKEKGTLAELNQFFDKKIMHLQCVRCEYHC